MAATIVLIIYVAVVDWAIDVAGEDEVVDVDEMSESIGLSPSRAISCPPRTFCVFFLWLFNLYHILGTL